MQEVNQNSNGPALIPIIVDVERNIDGYRMIRCSYFTVQSDEPLPNWRINVGGFNSPILLLNLEAILVGAPNSPHTFESPEDIEKMYNYIEQNDELFVDINDIWLPIEWFGDVKIKQGMTFRIPDDRFSICWKLRNDKISIEEMFLDEEVQKDQIKSKPIKEPLVFFSEDETMVFKKWTDNQVEQSRNRYYENKHRTLKKIRS